MPPPSSADPARLLESLAAQGIQLGLERPRKLLAALGDPHLGLPTVLIAGTNGKGSTAALLAAMATAAGYRTGLFTSPHLESVEEEIRLDARPIAAGSLATLLRRVVTAARESLGGDPTPFEAMTAAAFLHFAEKRVDLMVAEAGMGGARDATNVAEPVVSVITSLSLEHRRWLGETLEEIAHEKAGVLRAGRPALCGTSGSRDRTDHERLVRGLLEAEAAARGARFHWVPDEVTLLRREARGEGASAQEVRLETSRRRYRCELALAGEHQAWNLALAVRAAEELGEAGWDRLGATAVQAGAAGCRWPGRLEELQLENGRRVLLDGAHNPEAAAVLADHLEALGEPYDLLFGVFADKDAGPMLARLAPSARHLTFTRPPHPRGRHPEELATLLPETRPAVVEPDPATALERALGRRPSLLVVCGSLALVGWVRGRLRRTVD